MIALRFFAGLVLAAFAANSADGHIPRPQARTFGCSNWSRRLTEDRLTLDATKKWTNSFTYDNGQTAGPGVLTKSGAPTSTSAQWSGTKDAFLRINGETNSAVKRSASGRINGESTVTVKLDGQPVPVIVLTNFSTNWPFQWRGTLETSTGAHQLKIEVAHPSGRFTTNATSWFTNVVAYESVTDGFDAAGFQTNRVWMQGANAVRRQSLRWDAKGRLHQVSDRLTQWTNSTPLATNGVDFSATYNALGRLLRTVETPIINSVTNTAAQITIKHYYDPEYEFLEAGVNENGHVTWKVLGPDLNGVYGGQNGTGGFEAIAPGRELFCPVVADAHGNLLGLYVPHHTNFVWYSSRLTGYGAVSGYRPIPLGQVGPDLAAKYAWRNRGATSIGLVYMGGNWYDPESGQFISPDPAGHIGSPSLYSFAHGNPWKFWDADGRLGWAPGIPVWQRMPFEYRLAEIVARAGGDYGFTATPQRSFRDRFWNAAVRGDYASDDNGFAGFLGQTAAGLTPVGWAGDIRDLSAAVSDIRNQGLGWRTGGGLVLSAVAVVPVVGDAAKGILKPILRRGDDLPTPPRGSGGTPSGGATPDAAKGVGSGPAKGFLEVSDAYASSRAVQNFGSARPTDFIFDAQSQRFIMGRGPFGHDSVLQAGRISPSQTTVGGRIFRQDGRLMTDEWSGHYGQNWTPELRQQFQNFMQQHGVDITHTPWGQ